MTKHLTWLIAALCAAVPGMSQSIAFDGSIAVSGSISMTNEPAQGHNGLVFTVGITNDSGGVLSDGAALIVTAAPPPPSNFRVTTTRTSKITVKGSREQ